MWNLVCESLLAGFVTMIIGHIIFNLSINKKNKNNERKEPEGGILAFFMTGFIVNLFLELSGFNKWNCDRNCSLAMKQLCKLN